MSVATFTKAGTKTSSPAKLDKKIFGASTDKHSLLQEAYIAHLANMRSNLAKTKQRGEVRGGGRKPWRQKGTGNARVGSRRSPLWRGGGITFGPTGNENYSRQMNVKAKRQAIRQALSLAAADGRVKIIQGFVSDGKVKSTLALLNKIGLEGSVLLVLDKVDEVTKRSTKNLVNVRTTMASNLTVFSIMNADNVVISQDALNVINQWLGEKK